MADDRLGKMIKDIQAAFLASRKTVATPEATDVETQGVLAHSLFGPPPGPSAHAAANRESAHQLNPQERAQQALEYAASVLPVEDDTEDENDDDFLGDDPALDELRLALAMATSGVNVPYGDPSDDEAEEAYNGFSLEILVEAEVPGQLQRKGGAAVCTIASLLMAIALWSGTIRPMVDGKPTRERITDELMDKACKVQMARLQNLPTGASVDTTGNTLTSDVLADETYCTLEDALAALKGFAPEVTLPEFPLGRLWFGLTHASDNPEEGATTSAAAQMTKATTDDGGGGSVDLAAVAANLANAPSANMADLKKAMAEMFVPGNRSIMILTRAGSCNHTVVVWMQGGRGFSFDPLTGQMVSFSADGKWEVLWDFIFRRERIPDICEQYQASFLVLCGKKSDDAKKRQQEAQNTTNPGGEGPPSKKQKL